MASDPLSPSQTGGIEIARSFTEAELQNGVPRSLLNVNSRRGNAVDPLQDRPIMDAIPLRESPCRKRTLVDVLDDEQKNSLQHEVAEAEKWTSLRYDRLESQFGKLEKEVTEFLEGKVTEFECMMRKDRAEFMLRKERVTRLESQLGELEEKVEYMMRKESVELNELEAQLKELAADFARLRERVSLLS